MVGRGPLLSSPNVCKGPRAMESVGVGWLPLPALESLWIQDKFYTNTQSLKNPLDFCRKKKVLILAVTTVYTNICILCVQSK